MHVRRFWFLVVLMSLAVTSLPAAKRSGDSGTDQPRRTRVDFELYQDYLIIVRVSVGPLKNLNFLLDTGATPSVLDPRLKEKLHLVTAPMDISVLKGTVKGETATVPSLQFGPIRKDNVAVSIQDLSFLQKGLPVRLDGIVGLDILGQSPFVIDYTSHEIRFGPPSSMSDSIPSQGRAGNSRCICESGTGPSACRYRGFFDDSLRGDARSCIRLKIRWTYSVAKDHR